MNRRSNPGARSHLDQDEPLALRALEIRARATKAFDLPVGHPVHGSRYVRSYCSRCGDAIRVVLPSPGGRCEDCEPALPCGFMRVGARIPLHVHDEV